MTQGVSGIYDKLTSIINGTQEQPTIVNENSNFVVVTYWWGRGNQNANLARPCLFLYEQFISNVIETAIVTLSDFKKNMKSEPKIYEHVLETIQRTKIEKALSKAINDYYYELFLYLGLSPKCYASEPNAAKNGLKDFAVNEAISKKKVAIEPDFKYESHEYYKVLLKFVAVELLKQSKSQLAQIIKNKEELTDLKDHFSNKTMNSKEILAKIKALKQKNDALKGEIKQGLRKTGLAYVSELEEYKQSGKEERNIPSSFKDPVFLGIYDDPAVKGKSLIQIMISKMKYKPSRSYEAMIEEWKEVCAKIGCNYMAVEYPEFAQPGGYQLAINAKPMFIEKALQLCGTRNVLYIDGDMYLRKFPTIFEMKDIDYMARGWNIDPRASDQFTESILYDPYTFETSGGTMFFSQSKEAKKLLQLWIDETKKEINAGKADDRIISLIFNTKRLLMNMKIVQLPIEYLWLTLSYDDFLADTLYEDNLSMHNTIFIEHPECLTSEDTAAGSGASSSRTPFIYDKFINSITDPVSEELYENIFFEKEEEAAAFKHYFDYLKGAYYFADGNEALLQKQLVSLAEDAKKGDNEQPLYLFNFQKPFGNRNDMHTKNVGFSKKVNLEDYARVSGTNVVEFKNTPADEIIPNILRAIEQGIPCLVYTDATSGKVDGFKADYKIYKNVDIVYEPVYDEVKTTTGGYNNLYKGGIDPKGIVFINAQREKENSVLYKYISMFETLDDLSYYMKYGAYHLISRVRAAYLKPAGKVKGGDAIHDLDDTDAPESFDAAMNQYFSGLDMMYGDSVDVETPEMADDMNEYYNGLDMMYDTDEEEGVSPNQPPIAPAAPAPVLQEKIVPPTSIPSVKPEATTIGESATASSPTTIQPDITPSAITPKPAVMAGGRKRTYKKRYYKSKTRSSFFR